jgi:hypothetical protein
VYRVACRATLVMYVLSRKFDSLLVYFVSSVELVLITC